MGYTIVEFSSTMRLKAISFTNLLANSSTGKTPVYSYFDQALHNIERLNEIASNDSKISNCATVEGLVEHLKNNGSIYSSFDESSTFFGALG